MEEKLIQAKSLESTSATVSASSTHLLPSNPTPYGSLHNIFRKGAEIHKMNSENITMVKPTETHLDDRVEAIPSGESVFKTFAFNQAISKDETEKCLSFWRSVVERNLEPVKCTLITNLTENQSEGQKQVKTKKKKPKITVVEQEKKPSVWLGILQELQEKKLHQTELLIGKRCRFCNYLNSPYQSEDPGKRDKEMINELATWKPQTNKLKKSINLSDPQTFSLVKLLGKGTLVNKGSKEKPPKETEEGKNGQSAENSNEPVKGRNLNEQHLQEIRQKSEKIKYVDAVEVKKQQGAYSKWRECQCGKSQCDCTNPAISAETLTSETSQEQENEVYEVSRQSKSATSPEKTISLILNCVCDCSNCDCPKVPVKSVHTALSKKVDPLERGKQRPSRSSVKGNAAEERHNSMGKIKSVNSLEIARKRLSAKCEDNQSNLSDSELDTRKRYVSIVIDK